jgi:hypothetical protein
LKKKKKKKKKRGKMRRGKIAFPLFGWHERKESGLIGENHFLWGLPFAINPYLGGKRGGRREIEMILNFIL